jgi:hypothetical protein
VTGRFARLNQGRRIIAALHDASDDRGLLSLRTFTERGEDLIYFTNFDVGLGSVTAVVDLQACSVGLGEESRFGKGFVVFGRGDFSGDFTAKVRPVIEAGCVFGFERNEREFADAVRFVGVENWESADDGPSVRKVELVGVERVGGQCLLVVGNS